MSTWYYSGKARTIGNHKCYMEILTGSSIPERAVRRMVSLKRCSNMNMEKAKPQKKVTPEHSTSSELNTSSSLNKECFLNLSTNT